MSLMDFEDTQAIEGGGEAREKVERFVLNILESVEMEISEYVFSVFQHGRGGEGDDPVYSTEYERKSNKREALIKASQEIAEELCEAAEQDVENFLRGKHKYVVRCDNVKARCVFTLIVNETEDDDMDDIEETPNKKGLLSQMMRHQEKIMKVAIGATKNVIDMQNKTIREQSERIQALETQQIEGIRLTEELVSGRHARDIELRKIEKKEKRMDEIAGMVMQGAPMLLHMVAASGNKGGGGGGGDNGAPAAAAASGELTGSRIEQLTEMLLMSLMADPENLMKIKESGLFSDEQILTIIQLAQAVQEKKTGNS